MGLGSVAKIRVADASTPLATPQAHRACWIGKAHGPFIVVLIIVPYVGVAVEMGTFRLCSVDVSYHTAPESNRARRFVVCATLVLFRSSPRARGCPLCRRGARLGQSGPSCVSSPCSARALRDCFVDHLIDDLGEAITDGRRRSWLRVADRLLRCSRQGVVKTDETLEHPPTPLALDGELW